MLFNPFVLIFYSCRKEKLVIATKRLELRKNYNSESRYLDSPVEVESNYHNNILRFTKIFKKIICENKNH